MAYLQEMFATSMRGINERFDSLEKAIQVVVEQQQKNEKKLEELMASKVFKSKVIVMIQPVSAARQHLYNLTSVYRVIE